VFVRQQLELLRTDPITVETHTQTYWQINDSLSFGKVLGIYNVKFTTHGRIVVDQGHEPSVSFWRLIGPLHEHWLLNQMRRTRQVVLKLFRLDVEVRHGVVWRKATTHDRSYPGHVRTQRRVHHEEENVVVRFHAEALIDAWELAVLFKQDLRRRKVQVVRSWVDGKALHQSCNVMGIRCVAFGVGPPEKDILVAHREIKYDLAIWSFIGVCGMTGECVWGTEPLGTDVNTETRCSSISHDTNLDVG